MVLETTRTIHPFTTLPVELIIAIIEDLASDNDKHALCAFSLVCSYLLPICRKHLFHTFDMRTGSQSTRGWHFVNKFAMFLSQHLHLVPYVRAVYILAVGTTHSNNWICTTPGLTYIIQLLTSLHTFELIVNDSSPWFCLPTPLKEALFFMVSQYNLKTLRITGITHIPLTLFTQARHLKSFHAHQVSCNATGLEVCQYPILLEELSLGHSTGLLHILVENTLFDCSSLRKITIDISSRPGDLKLSWSLIAHAGVSLQYLEFRHSNMHHPLSFLCFTDNGQYDFFPPDTEQLLIISLAAAPRLLPYITLQPLTTLQSFSFTVLFIGNPEEYPPDNYFDMSDFDDEDAPDGNTYSESAREQISHQMTMFVVAGFLPWCHLLETAPSSLRLITITMDCYALTNEELRNWFKISASSTWSDLDIILASPERLPMLQKVIFYVNLPDSSDSNDSESEEEDSLLGDDDLESIVDEKESPSLSFEEAAYFIRRNLKLTRRAVIVEVLSGDS